jgi:hypothetical protein
MTKCPSSWTATETLNTKVTEPNRSAATLHDDRVLRLEA